MESKATYKGKSIEKGFKSTLFVLADPLESKLYIVKKRGIRQFDLKTKNNIKFNEEKWTSATAACYGNNHIYIAHDDGNIYKIATNEGSKATLVSSEWKNVKYMIYHGETIYIFANHLWQLNPSTGKYFSDSNKDWTETKCATITDTGCWVATTNLYRGDISTGKFEIMNEETWKNTKCLFSTGNVVYAVCRELYLIHGDGNYEKIFVDWGKGEDSLKGQDILSICGSNNKLYGIWDSGKLWEIELA